MEIITAEQTATLRRLFDLWEGVSIQSDEDYQRLGEMFDEEI